MKFGTKERAADFLVYEYGNMHRFGKIISLADNEELRYILFEDEKNVGHTINVVYSDINFTVFYSVNAQVDNVSQMWRYYNYKKNPEKYQEHMEKLIKLQKNQFEKETSQEDKSKIIELDKILGFEESF